jgi:hypothetical protein
MPSEIISYLLTCLYIPNSNYVITAASDNFLTISRESNAVYFTMNTFDSLNFFSVISIPNYYFVSLSWDLDDLFSISRQINLIISTISINDFNLSPCPCFPYYNLSITYRYYIFAIRGGINTTDTFCMQVSEDLLIYLKKNNFQIMINCQKLS